MGKLGEQRASGTRYETHAARNTLDVDVDVDVGVVEQRRQSLAGIAQASGFVRHTRGTSVFRTHGSLSSQICYGSRTAKRGKCDRSRWESHVLHRHGRMGGVIFRTRYYCFIFGIMGRYVGSQISTLSDPVPMGPYTLLRSPVPRRQRRHSGATMHRNAAATIATGRPS